MDRLFLLALLVLGGCASPYQQTVDDYMGAYPLIDLGMSKEQVAGILASSQKRLSTSEIKQPDRYMKDGVAVDIIYYRSGWQSDGITTDDEFTPYLFNDNKLVAIGWRSIGGAKSQGQATNSTYSSPSTTVIVY
jgi:hypothetical protein